jgi:hypothetical protein
MSSLELGFAGCKGLEKLNGDRGLRGKARRRLGGLCRFLSGLKELMISCLWLLGSNRFEVMDLELVMIGGVLGCIDFEESRGFSGRMRSGLDGGLGLCLETFEVRRLGA